MPEPLLQAIILYVRDLLLAAMVSVQSRGGHPRKFRDSGRGASDLRAPSALASAAICIRKKARQARRISAGGA